MRSKQAVVSSLCAIALIAMSGCGSDTESSPAETPPPETSSPGEDDHDAEHDDDHDEHDDEKHEDDHDDDHDEGGAGLGAHEHGAAELTLAWIGDQVSVELISPNFNVFGFEYEPSTDEDLATEQERTATLTGPGILSLDAAAGCELIEPPDTAIERDDTHSEIIVSWTFACDDPGAITELDATGLFAAFANFDDIDAQWITDSTQSSAELTPSSPTLLLDG